MTEYTMAELDQWNTLIEELVQATGLDCYEQHFEICNYEDMLCYEAYVGMPSHYPHWSFGKSYERQKMYYQYNLAGLPYEMVINSDPCLAYLMKDNTLLLQILTMAHVYGHNDFFKNNRLFKRDTRADLTLEMFKYHADRVRSFIQDPSIGPEKVERIIDAAHALRYQIPRNGVNSAPATRGEQAKEELIGLPERLKNDLLGFLAERGRLAEWERHLVNIVREETMYFIPQIETKIMNEGWASYWHYNVLNDLKMSQALHLEFLQRHNNVIRPHLGRINPYFVGFKMFEYLDKQHGRDFILAVRESERDQSFIRRYLNQELCSELHLFNYQPEGDNLVISAVADEEGWKEIRDELANSVGLGNIPAIYPKDIDKGTLILEHLYDGRELEMTYANETLKYAVDLWGGPVKLLTMLQDREKIISCDENKKISHIL